jgi:two-component system, LuxR family, response regulator FixJ
MMGRVSPFISRTAIPSAEPFVFIVDDDKSVNDALTLLLRLEGFATQCFSDGLSFLDAVRDEPPACVIPDMQLPGFSGLSVLKELSAARFAAPIIVISGLSDVPTAVSAMKNGALDFLEKPFPAYAMVAKVHEAITTYRRSAENLMQGFADLPGRHLLTTREREVLSQVANGASNKEAGRRLGISPRTIEVHRARIMSKLGAKNAADLMRIVLSQSAGQRYASIR